MKVFTLFLFIFASVSLKAQQTGSPKLVVGIVVDQMCYDYLYRYKRKFSSGGFSYLMGNGLNCRNVHYNYVPTFTGPGHASIYTGTTPNNHGIVGNEWYDRTTGKVVNCVEDSTVMSIGTTSNDGKFSPRNLKCNTISDQLKLTYPKAKVISMSIKNRGAILPGGHLSDGSYWYDFATGNFITSSYYKTQLPDWVEKFNAKGQVAEYMKGKWTTLLPIGEYTESGPDNSPYEHILPGKTTPTFPYDFNEMTNGVVNNELFVYTPFANTYLTDFAIASIDSERLGKDSQTDMLCISYSTPDIVGHAFGPYSVEMEDMYLRLDLEIRKLIKALELKVGKYDFTIFLTADHGVVPVPQQLIDEKLPGGYVFLNERIAQLRDTLETVYGEDFIVSEQNLNIYLDHTKIAAKKLPLREVQQFVADCVLRWEGVKRSFTGDQIYNAGYDGEWMDMVRRGYHHAESGDVVFILESGYLAKSVDSEGARKGTSHGSSFNYDTHVPLLWYGKGIPFGEYYHHTDITDIAATLVHLLYIQNPSALTGKPILNLLYNN